MGKKKEVISFNTSVSCEQYYQDVMFHFGDTELLFKTIEKFFDKEKAKEIKDVLEEDDEYTLGRTIDLGSGQLVYLRELPKDEKGYALLAHEIFHAVFMMTKKIGIEYSSEGEEAYAYLIQYLTETVLREYSKYH